MPAAPDAQSSADITQRSMRALVGPLAFMLVCLGGVIFLIVSAVATPSLPGLAGDGGLRGSDQPEASPDEVAGGRSGGGADVAAGFDVFEVQSTDHVDSAVAYEQDPPVGGPHYAMWQACGFYAEPVVTEQAVHSLEHGAIWITYRPDLPVEDIEALRLMASEIRHVLASPWPSLSHPVVASAWGRQVRLDSVDDPRLDSFIQRFLMGRQAPEPQGSCEAVPAAGERSNLAGAPGGG